MGKLHWTHLIMSSIISLMSKNWNYYNDSDPFCCEWVKNLIKEGLIPPGDVDDRSIEDVFPIDLVGYTQVHMFCGIAGWSYAARLAGWPDSRPCYTASCPCQPFSAAGKGGGMSDERHLWPAFFHLIQQLRPDTIFGEQVASKAGLAWLDLVQTDLEASGYATAAVDLCAAGIGAPHIRQRLFWCADSNGRNSGAERQQRSGKQRLLTEDCSPGLSPDTESPNRRPKFPINPNPYGRDGLGGSSFLSQPGSSSPTSSSSSNSGRQRLQEQLLNGRISIATMEPSEGETFVRAGYTRGFWKGCDWWHGRDEKFRPIEPGIQPLATGISKRVGKLRGYGNSIVPEITAEFIAAYMECCPGLNENIRLFDFFS
jgi:DNA (cytosine-5)-methyltransferase 1